MDFAAARQGQMIATPSGERRYRNSAVYVMASARARAGGYPLGIHLSVFDGKPPEDEGDWGVCALIIGGAGSKRP